MTCNIINPDHAKINGGNSAYGGFLTSVSLNLAGLNGGNSANVTLEGVGLQRPKPGDQITIDIMGQKMKFDIAGFNYNDSADSIPTLTLNCQDTSHRYLDHNFIGLRGDIPEGINNVYALGFKFGKKPNSNALSTLGNYASDSDEQWVKLEDAYQEAGIPNPAQKAADTPGKTLYFGGGRYSLEWAMGNLLGVFIPAGPYDATGSFRAVLSQISNETGIFMYWDLNKDVVKGFKPSNVSKGASILKSWTSLPGCKVLSIGDSNDFTVTQGVGAIGTFDSDAPDKGGKPSKYYSAELLDPDLHYSGCGNPDAPLTVIDLDDFDVQMAMGASYDPRIYSYFVLQAILTQNSSKGVLSETIGFDLKGRNDVNPNQVIRLQDNFTATPFPGLRSPNQPNWGNFFLEDYYITNSKDTSNCSMKKLYPVAVIPDTVVAENMVKKEEQEWSKNQNKFPRFVGGDFGANENEDLEFRNASMFIHKPDIATTILNTDGSLSGDSDILRLYLQSIIAFKNNFFVVTGCFKDKGKKKCSKDGEFYYEVNPKTGKPKKIKIPNVMGFLATTDKSTAISSAEPEDGYEHHPINPFVSLEECGISTLQEFAVNLFFMYIKGQCISTFMPKYSVVGFIYALYNNKLKEYFEEVKAGGNGDIKKLEDEWKANNTRLAEDPELNIHIISKNAESNVNPFAKTEFTCVNQGQKKNISLSGSAEIVTKLYGKIDADWGQGPNAIFGEGAVDLGPNLPEGGRIENTSKIHNLRLISCSSFIANFIQPVEIGEGKQQVKLWYDVGQSGGGDFHMGYGNMINQNKTWTKRLETGLTITAADVGLTNQGFASFAADAADRFNKVSRRNQSLMFNELKLKVDKSVYIDDLVAEKYTAEALITKEGTVTIPSFEEGLESLTISSSPNGDSSVTVTVGNAAVRAARKAMAESIAKGTKGMQSNRTITNDPKYNMSNTQLKRLM